MDRIAGVLNVDGTQIWKKPMSIEAIIWCPSCEEDRIELNRVPTGQEGCYKHEPRMLNGQENTKTCFSCGGFLERKIDAPS